MRSGWPDTDTCEHLSSTHPDYREDPEGGTPRGERRDPMDLAREELAHQVPGFLDGDVIEPAGYPEAAPRSFRTVRDGTVPEVAWYRSDGEGGWFFGGVTFCDEG